MVKALISPPCSETYRRPSRPNCSEVGFCNETPLRALEAKLYCAFASIAPDKSFGGNLGLFFRSPVTWPSANSGSIKKLIKQKKNANSLLQSVFFRHIKQLL